MTRNQEEDTSVDQVEMDALRDGLIEQLGAGGRGVGDGDEEPDAVYCEINGTPVVLHIEPMSGT